MSMLGRPTSLLPYVKGPMACWSTRLSNWILRSIPVLSRPRKSSFGENRMKGPGSPVNGENAVSCPLLREQRSLIIAAVPPDWLGDCVKTPENREIACAFVIYYLLRLSAMGTQRALFEFSHSLLEERGNRRGGGLILATNSDPLGCENSGAEDVNQINK